MLQLTNYSKLPSIIFNSVELNPNEKIMLAYLTNRANYFNREDDWFGVPLCCFASDIGFNDHHKVSDVRKSLVNMGLIEYKRGGNAKSSKYKVCWDNIYENLTSRYETKTEEENQINDVINEKIEDVINNKKSNYDISFENPEFRKKLTAMKENISRQFNVAEEEVRNNIINTFNNKIKI